MRGRTASAPPGWWTAAFRAATGAYWLYFSSQKWHGVDWMRPLMERAPAVNPVPGLRDLLAQLVAPHWLPFAIAQAGAELTAGVLLVLGLFTRGAAALGLLLALDLALTVAFLDPDLGSRWLYYLAVLVNAQVLAAGAGRPALDAFRRGGRWRAR